MTNQESRMSYRVNLACGQHFISDGNWINLDYDPRSASVKRANLLEKLPIPDKSAEVVYCSHFLEHIPYKMITTFLGECLRILQPAGILRLALPDMESMCRTYLDLRANSHHDKANLMLLSIVDQCVRSEPGGELGRLYRELEASDPARKTLIDFIEQRTGHEVLPKPKSLDRSGQASSQSTPLAVLRRIRRGGERMWIKLVLQALPRSVRLQNITQTEVGEKHQWVWDFYQLEVKLKEVGYCNIMRCEASSSRIKEFPTYPLDLNEKGAPRKGLDSMYIEAARPG